MILNHIIKKISSSKDHFKNIDFFTSYKLYKKILSDKIPDLELGSILMALRIKGESTNEIQGFYKAIQEIIPKLDVPKKALMPIIIPSYSGARNQSNLTPLLALILVNLGFPVLVHGIKKDKKRITSKEIFFFLGFRQFKNFLQIQTAINKSNLVFTTIDNFCPAISKQLLLKNRMGVRNITHILIKLITPFKIGKSLRLVNFTHYNYIPLIINILSKSNSPSIFFKGTEGEAYANPYYCPIFNYFNSYKNEINKILFKNEVIPKKEFLPESKDPEITARWIEKVLARKISLPKSILMQISCCLFVTGYSKTLKEAFEKINDEGFK